MGSLIGVDAAFGWAIILTLALASYLGIPWLIAATVRNHAASTEARSTEREQMQDDLDELARQNLLSTLASEPHDPATRR